jgi:hypothetical protein
MLALLLALLLFLLSLSSSVALWLSLQLYAWLLRRANVAQRQSVFQALGIPLSEHIKFIGFFHPYW